MIHFHCHLLLKAAVIPDGMQLLLISEISKQRSKYKRNNQYYV